MSILKIKSFNEFTRQYITTCNEHLLLAVSAASPVTSNGDCSYCHQKDDHHVVVQHWLIGCIHGNQSSFAKGLQELKTALSQVIAKDFLPIKHAIFYILYACLLSAVKYTDICLCSHNVKVLELINFAELSERESLAQYDPAGSHRFVRLCR